MNWLRQNSMLAAVLLACAAGLVIEGWLLHRARQQAIRAGRTLEAKKNEQDRLTHPSRGERAEEERATAENLAEAGATLAKLHAALTGPTSGGGWRPPPATSTEAYFDLAAWVEKARALATQAQVVVKRDEHFGFSSHAIEGPEPELIAAVFRQRIAGEYLVGALLESRPRTLFSMQRERPLAGNDRPRGNQPARPPADPKSGPSGGRGQPGDFFEFDPALALRMTGRTESEAFRMEFSGHTGALRSFLNRLADDGWPVIVRSVEVEPLTGEKAPTVAVEPGARVPRVAQAISRFTVVVEVIVPVDLSGAPLS